MYPKMSMCANKEDYYRQLSDALRKENEHLRAEARGWKRACEAQEIRAQFELRISEKAKRERDEALDTCDGYRTLMAECRAIWDEYWEGDGERCDAIRHKLDAALSAAPSPKPCPKCAAYEAQIAEARKALVDTRSALDYAMEMCRAGHDAEVIHGGIGWNRINKMRDAALSAAPEVVCRNCGGRGTCLEPTEYEQGSGDPIIDGLGGGELIDSERILCPVCCGHGKQKLRAPE